MNQKVTGVVYQSLSQVLKYLTDPKFVNEIPVQELLMTGLRASLLRFDEKGENIGLNHQWSPEIYEARPPLIVIEGLDGCGKSSIVKHLTKTLKKLTPMKTPPQEIRNLKEYFDDEPEELKRAYYSFGNYLAAHYYIRRYSPTILDRYWHSTFASAIAILSKDHPEIQLDAEFKVDWPSDLVKPDLVVFMNVSEEERLRRHKDRASFTNTEEEQIIAADPIYRQNLIDAYRRVVGPNLREIDVNNVDRSKNEGAVLKCVSEELEKFKNKRRRRGRISDIIS